MTTRKIIGCVLVSGSVLACVFALVFLSDWREVSPGEPEGGILSLGVAHVHVGWRFELGVVTAGALGLKCLVDASRRPPKR